MIRECKPADTESIVEIINDGATAYQGIIPDDCWKDPYMSLEELLREIDEGVQFWGYELDGVLVGVMGLQFVKDAALVRHAYVRSRERNRGIGTHLLLHLRGMTVVPLLIGTWADASWAIHFYERHGFREVGSKERTELLNRYWNISSRQVETSTVLVEKNAVSEVPI